MFRIKLSMKKPIIALVSRIYEKNNKKVYGVYETYLNKIIKNGGVPLIIPKIQLDIENKLTDKEKDDLIKLLELCDGIVMPGGDDPYDYDFFINEYAIKNDIPILGICLGMQIMGLSDGSELVKINNHYLTKHFVYLKNNTYLKKIYNEDNVIVNSRHKYAIIEVKNYIVSSISDVIESIEYPNKKFNIGVQWHPEELEDDKLFKEFISKCKD